MTFYILRCFICPENKDYRYDLLLQNLFLIFLSGAFEMPPTSATYKFVSTAKSHPTSFVFQIFFIFSSYCFLAQPNVIFIEGIVGRSRRKLFQRYSVIHVKKTFSVRLEEGPRLSLGCNRLSSPLKLSSILQLLITELI
jgi:hypothetical protein